MAKAVPVLDVKDALSDATARAQRRHVLLGNGFSIACRPTCFTYGALLDEADFSPASIDIRPIFKLLGTVDFERVIEALRLSADLVETYSSNTALCGRLRADAAVVREALAKVLAARHPNLPFDITHHEYESARTFLAEFERIYTVNYDMLLYWALMQEGEPRPPRNDGFGDPDDDDAPYVAWEPYMDFRGQRVFYLHGGLHLYDSGVDLAKMTWSRTGIPLVDQIRSALEEGRFPLIVTEGTTDEKERAIRHHAYLSHAIRSFSRIGGSLFAYGFSFSPNDQHITRRIEENTGIRTLYVGLYGKPTTAQNKAIIERANGLGTYRREQHELTVRFFDAESASVWS